MLESLHDRRVFVTSLFQRASRDVTQRLKDEGLQNEILALDNHLHDQMANFMKYQGSML